MDADPKDPADNLADQIRTHEAKITETSQGLDRLYQRMVLIETELKAILIQLRNHRL